MKEQAITHLLKAHVENLEKSCGFHANLDFSKAEHFGKRNGIKRDVFGKKNEKSWHSYYQINTTKAVKPSAIYLYELEKINETQPTFGISFDFYQKDSQHKKIPLDEQTVTFSYCYDINLPSSRRDIFYSEPLFLNEAKIIFKKLSKEIKESGYSCEKLFDLVEKIVMNYEDSDSETKIVQALEILEPSKNEIMNTIELSNKSRIDYNDTREHCIKLIHNSDEQAEVDKLEILLKKAKTKVHNLSKEKVAEFDIEGKRKTMDELTTKRKEDAKKLEVETKKVLKEIGLSNKHIKLFSPFYEDELN